MHQPVYWLMLASRKRTASSSRWTGSQSHGKRHTGTIAGLSARSDLASIKARACSSSNARSRRTSNVEGGTARWIVHARTSDQRGTRRTHAAWRLRGDSVLARSRAHASAALTVSGLPRALGVRGRLGRALRDHDRLHEEVAGSEVVRHELEPAGLEDGPRLRAVVHERDLRRVQPIVSLQHLAHHPVHAAEHHHARRAGVGPEDDELAVGLEHAAYLAQRARELEIGRA